MLRKWANRLCAFAAAMIHPTAIIHPGAELDATVEVGAYVVVDGHVRVGPDCRIGPHCYLTGHTTIGKGNQFHAGCVIGDAPQDLKYRDDPTRLRIGDENVFREHVTVHRSNKLTEDTVVGSHNFLMANSHVGHNSHLGDHIIIANGTLLGGHVCVADRAFLSGNCLLHQFVRVGTLALMQGGASISKDLPPYTIARGQNHISGLNTIGLRRAGISSADRLKLRRAYHALFRSGRPLHEGLENVRRDLGCEPVRVLAAFVESAKRGVCADPGAGLKNSADESTREETTAQQEA